MGPGGSSVLLFQFGTSMLPQNESHPQAEFRLLFAHVGAHRGTEAVGGISSAPSLLMQPRCSNLDAVQPYCFLSRPLSLEGGNSSEPPHNIGWAASGCCVQE